MLVIKLAIDPEALKRQQDAEIEALKKQQDAAIEALKKKQEEDVAALEKQNKKKELFLFSSLNPTKCCVCKKVPRRGVHCRTSVEEELFVCYNQGERKCENTLNSLFDSFVCCNCGKSATTLKSANSLLYGLCCLDVWEEKLRAQNKKRIDACAALLTKRTEKIIFQARAIKRARENEVEVIEVQQSIKKEKL